MARSLRKENGDLMTVSFEVECSRRLFATQNGRGRGLNQVRKVFLFLLLVPLLFLFFKGPSTVFADSSNGMNSGGMNSGGMNSGENPLMPGMMGSFGGGSNQPFKPMKTGILRYPGQGHMVTKDPDKCAQFHYNSNPPTSGLMTESFISKNDLNDKSLSPCTIVNVLHHGNIILFYDPSRVSPESLQTLHGIASNDNSSEGFIQQQKIGYAVTLVKAKFKDPIVLLAWRRLLPLAFLDHMKMNMFLGKYRGQIARSR